MPYLNMTFGQHPLPLEEEWVPLDIPDRRIKADPSRIDLINPPHYDPRALNMSAYPPFMTDNSMTSHPAYYSYPGMMNKSAPSKFQTFIKPPPMAMDQQRQQPHIPSIYHNALAPLAAGSESAYVHEAVSSQPVNGGYLISSPNNSPNILPRPQAPPGSRLFARLPSPPVEEPSREETVTALSRDFLRCQALSSPMCEIFDHQQLAVAIHLSSRLKGNWHLSDFENQELDNSILPKSRQLIFYRRNLFSVSTSILTKGIPATVRTSPSSVETISKLVCTLQLAQSAQRKRAPSSAQRKRQSSTTPRKRQVDLVDQHGDPVTETEIVYTRRAETGDFEAVCDWGKIKFSSATINNGAPNQQPYFQVVTTLSAVTQSGAKIALAQAISKQIIVRGRHPRFYKDRFGVSLNVENPSKTPQSTRKQT